MATEFVNGTLGRIEDVVLDAADPDVVKAIHFRPEGAVMERFATSIASFAAMVALPGRYQCSNHVAELGLKSGVDTKRPSSQPPHFGAAERQRYERSHHRIWLRLSPTIFRNRHWQVTPLSAPTGRRLI